ncbi:uncharacterized protein LOC123294684 [Chrysoperla carnea]|uniref:uncharacterized protein LOC123294684 n=1 Tax=Chrysoperla carnea TaxID=189513 RepID=UPI001D0619E8|nr:uncharacterized protein LOC123294684 [Chrysoperla carnea]
MDSKIILFFIFCITVFILPHSNQKLIEKYKEIDLSRSKNVSYRHERFFPFYSVVRFENSVCTGTCLLTGTCYTRKECKTYGGRPSGTCAKGLGVCCIVQKSCGGSSHVNNTYFQNPGFPNPYTGSSRCTVTITRCDPSICQLRLDFLSLDLAQPNIEGVCDTESLVVTGGASRVPVICGENSGQHVYVDFDGNEPIQLTIRTNASVNTMARSWNIKATQIACDCPTKAPSGCLMYYTEASGTVKSFNYGQSTGVTRQLANNNYGVCIEMAPNNCGIQWTATQMSFFVSGGDITLGPSIGTDLCNSDYVIIPNAMIQANDVVVAGDRICGSGPFTAISNSKPFALYVITNDEEQQSGDMSNLGFSLDYTQIPCSD